MDNISIHSRCRPPFVEVQKILEFILNVCRLSGVRGRGIFNCMDDNGGLPCVMSAVPHVYERFPWIDGCIEHNAVFFENILAALRPTFPNVGLSEMDIEHSIDRQPKWTGRDFRRYCMVFQIYDKEDLFECLKRFISACTVPYGVDLLSRLHENRMFLRMLHDHSKFFDQCLWVESWLEDFELLFCNINNVTRPYYQEIPGYYPLGYYPETSGYPAPWPGKNISCYLMPFLLQEEALSVSDFFRRQTGGPWHHG
jgi:hypothetical protein